MEVLEGGFVAYMVNAYYVCGEFFVVGLVLVVPSGVGCHM